MDAIIQDMENHKVQNDSGTMLQDSTGEQYLDALIASVFSNDEVDNALLLTGLGHLSELVRVELWRPRVTEELAQRLYDLIIATQEKNLITLQASLSMLTLLSSSFVSHSNGSEIQLSQVCIILQSDHHLLEQFSLLLRKYSANPTICRKIIRYLCVHVESVLQWVELDSEHAIPIAVKTNMRLKDFGILDQLSTLHYANKNSKEFKSSIIDFLNQLKRLKGVLKDRPHEDYDVEVVNEVRGLIHNLFDAYDVTKARFSKSNEDYPDLHGLSILQILNLRFVLMQNVLTFKKAFTEQLMFQNNPLPLLKTITTLSTMIWEFFEMSKYDNDPAPYFIHFVFHTKEIVVALLNTMVTMYGKSLAESATDFSSLADLLKILMHKAEEVCRSRDAKFVETFIDVCHSTTYEDLRELQVSQWREKQYTDWAEDIRTFDEILQNQVQEFVRYQRLLLMQKGTWVFSENPIEAKDKLPKVSFIALSDNQMNLLIREFKHKIEKTPTVQDNEIVTVENSAALNNKTSVVPLKSIVNIQSKQIELDRKIPKGARLINILQNTVYSEVTTFDRNGKILSAFFLESTESFYTWLDGLQLLSQSKNATLSMETEKQIDSLIKLRRNVQLAALDDKFKDDESIESFSEDDIDELYYNQETLKQLSENLYYE